MKLINILKEIKIRNVNKPSQYPKDKDWYVEVNRRNYDKVMNDLRNQGFRFTIDYYYIYETLTISFGTPSNNIMYISFSTITNEIDCDWESQLDNLESWANKIQVINEIKIRNANVDLQTVARNQAKELADSIDEPEDSTTYYPNQNEQFPELYDWLSGHWTEDLSIINKNGIKASFYISDYDDSITWEYFL